MYYHIKLQYQEEVIDNLWQNYTSLKKTCDQKDETINQLYYRLSTISIHNKDQKDRISTSTTATTPPTGYSTPNKNNSRSNNYMNDIDFNNDNSRLSSVKSPEESITFMV